MLRAKLFALYESVPQLIFQVLALMMNEGDVHFTWISLALSALSMLLVVAKGILLAASGDLDVPANYVELALDADVETLEVQDPTTRPSVPGLQQLPESALKGTLKPWRALRKTNFDIPGRYSFQDSTLAGILADSHTNGERLLLSFFSENNLGVLAGPDLRKFMEVRHCTPDDFCRKSLEILKDFKTDAILGLRVLQPSRFAGGKLLVRFPMPKENNSTLKVDVGRAEVGGQEFSFDSSSQRLALSKDSTVSRLVAEVKCRVCYPAPFQFTLLPAKSVTPIALLSCLPDRLQLKDEDDDVEWFPPRSIDQVRWFVKPSDQVELQVDDVIQVGNQIMCMVDFVSSPTFETLMKLYGEPELHTRCDKVCPHRVATEEYWDQLLERHWPGYRHVDPALNAILQRVWQERVKLKRLYPCMYDDDEECGDDLDQM